MNLEGYGSDDDSSDDLRIANSQNATELLKSEMGPAFVVAPGVQSTFGGQFQRAIPTPKIGTKRTREARKNKRKKQKNDPESLDFRGPWDASSSSGESPSEQESEEDLHEPEKPAAETEIPASTESYATDRFMKAEPESGDSKQNSTTFPRKMKHSIHAHSKGVTRLRYFPKSGHLLLSCGNDHKIFLWSVTAEKIRKIRGYFGHTQAVKDVVFNHTGDRFLSCSYDNTMVLWETETGKILQRLHFPATPNCVLFNPNAENEIVVGLANRRIEHYDLTSPHQALQIYDHHLGAINSLTSVSSGSVFMSTSDDRTVRFWKWHINIPTKIISDPTKHSVPCATAHPSKKFIALQSMDDMVYVIQDSAKYRSTRKQFKGHKVTGYGIEIGCSCHGKYLMSGDAYGHVYVWSWQEGNIVQKIKLGGELISCVAAHPRKENVVAAAGRRGDIYICT